ncbi:hypothetical protein HAZT_HAZT005941 [Hyalella azteca]|uniref:Nuclear receptor coactivator 6 TRADD-N domain-containing protein n=1 Tax=Hyalella azteca TaxID=294128 RepID=A0A6A0GRJ4_HYAAZ|nr:hypothetical protein HAZT_HAZT005941 [Hyalella azteca]
MTGRLVNSSPTVNGKDGEETPTSSPGCCHHKRNSNGGGGGDVDEEEEEEDAGETTMVLTCEGNITDPNLSTKLECLMHRLQHLTQCERAPRVHVVEPWNSVRVTFSIPREAARRLNLLAQAGEPALRSLGILSVQVQGDQASLVRLPAMYQLTIMAITNITILTKLCSIELLILNQCQAFSMANRSLRVRQLCSHIALLWCAVPPVPCFTIDLHM